MQNPTPAPSPDTQTRATPHSCTLTHKPRIRLQVDQHGAIIKGKRRTHLGLHRGACCRQDPHQVRELCVWSEEALVGETSSEEEGRRAWAAGVLCHVFLLEHGPTRVSSQSESGNLAAGMGREWLPALNILGPQQLCLGVPGQLHFEHV